MIHKSAWFGLLAAVSVAVLATASIGLADEPPRVDAPTEFAFDCLVSEGVEAVEDLTVSVMPDGQVFFFSDAAQPWFSVKQGMSGDVAVLVDACAEAASVSFSSGDYAVLSDPIAAVTFEDCMENAGFTSTNIVAEFGGERELSISYESNGEPFDDIEPARSAAGYECYRLSMQQHHDR